MPVTRSFILAGATLVAGLLAQQAAAGEAPCVIEQPCAVAAGSYLVHQPKNWDGKSALPALVYFHAYRGSAADEMRNAEMIRFADETGNLLILPNGENGQWSFPGSPHPGRDEMAFVAAVLDDVEAKFPIDQTRLWASGFSIGGSMTWYAACYLGSRFAAFAPIAGSFWEPLPEHCPSGPANIRHIHGLTDRTVPLEGRTLRGGSIRQGDSWVGLALWKKIDGCKAEPARFEAEERPDRMICRVWQGCTSGKELQLCLHPGEHEIWTQWLRDGYAWVERLAGADKITH
jgi:polyhydroxybutyrate depolymerase